MKEHGAKYRSLGPFLEELEQRLGKLTVEELREALVRRAEGLRPAQREDFLDIFRSRGRQATSRADDPLLADIDAFVQRLRSEAYAEGYGWDPDLHDERVYGDESWAWEMDDLFAGAADAFLEGEYRLAAEAYGRLLHAFLLEEEGNAFPGALTAPESVETDVPEAFARYLRAIYESASPQECADRFTSALEVLWRLDPEFSLARMSATRRDPASDLPDFLPHWIKGLEACPHSDWGLGPVVGRLLAEATELHGGLDALGELARSRAAVEPKACLRWVDALIAQEDARAEASCTEALEMLRAGRGRAPEICSLVAERLASLRGTAGDQDGVLAAWVLAWRSSPTTARLVGLVEAARACGREDETLQAEADALEARGHGQKAHPAGSNAGLACATLLLAGRVEAVVRRTRRAEPLGWHDSLHPAPVVIPFLLAAAGKPEDVRRTRAWRLLRGVAERVGFYDHEDGSIQGAATSLADLLAGSLEHRPPPSHEERQRWLEAARKQVQRRAAAVLQAKHRDAYERVALLVAACSEAIGLFDGERSGESFLREIRERYSRYPAFKRELERALGSR